VGGYEPVSTSLSFVMYFLSKHPDIQEKLRNQVLGVTRSHGGEMSYDALKEMYYLEAVINGNNIFFTLKTR
jgi:cytochrome P450 family 6